MSTSTVSPDLVLLRKSIEGYIASGFDNSAIQSARTAVEMMGDDMPPELARTLTEAIRQMVASSPLLERSSTPRTTHTDPRIPDLPDGFRVALDRVTGVPRSNRYPGLCTICEQRIEALGGLLVQGSKWGVVHERGKCPLPATIKGRLGEPRPASGTPVEPADPAVEPGYYALFSDGVGNEAGHIIAFYRVRVRFPGAKPYVTQLSGDNQRPVSKVRRHDILVRIHRDPLKAMRLYGKEIGRCGACHRRLTDDESRLRGIGPDCAKRLGVA